MTPFSELTNEKILGTVKGLQILQLQAELLQRDQRTLIEQARKEADAPADHIPNTDTRTFQPPAGAGG